MNLPTFQQVSGRMSAVHRVALSMCFYMSDKFDAKKHLEPLFTHEKCDADFLIFTDCDKLEEAVPKKCRIFKTDRPLSGYHKHFYRYAAGQIWKQYEWFWFTGTDNPWLGHRLKLIETAEKHDLGIITQCSNATEVTANLALKGSYARDLMLTLTKGVNGPAYADTEWHCDDKFLRQYFKKITDPRLHLQHERFATWAINEDHALWILASRPGSIIISKPN